MVLKPTYKASGITGTYMFNPFIYACVSELSKNHSGMIQISSKVFSISVCENKTFSFT